MGRVGLRRVHARARCRAGRRLAAAQVPRRALLKCLGDAPVHPDGHARFGHAFGSDPWISLLLHRCAPGAPAAARAIVGSLALNGYFAIAEIGYDAAARFRLDDTA